MSDKTQHDDDRTARLVEYLDGESNPKTAAEIEGAVARDPKIRREIESLQRAWDMLDFLPMPGAKSDFSQRTVEMVTQSLPAVDALSSDVKRRTPVAWWLAGVAASFSLGVGLVLLMQSKDDRKLVENRAVLENLDDYRAVGDVRFLDLLQSEKLADHIDSNLEPSS